MMRAATFPAPSPPVAQWHHRLDSLCCGEQLTLVAMDGGMLASRVAATRPLLWLDWAGVHEAGPIVGRILDDLSDLALASWPAWPPSSLASWRRAADRLAAAGRRPRFARLPPRTQFAALYPAAASPVLVFSVDPTRSVRAAPAIAAAEWAREGGGAVLILFAAAPPAAPPWDRVLYGALTLDAAPPTPAATRLVVPPRDAVAGSAIEQRMRRAIGDDPGLSGLFDHEVTLRLGPLGPTPRVDMVWRAGKIVVELDGHEHERNPTYAADRHRDYELTAAGYLVLRLTNAEVEFDLARCLAKVRRFVDLRRPA